MLYMLWRGRREEGEGRKEQTAGPTPFYEHLCHKVSCDFIARPPGAVPPWEQPKVQVLWICPGTGLRQRSSRCVYLQAHGMELKA